MTSTYDDTVFDFDLNLFNQSTSSTTLQEKYERLKKSITVLKKRIVATDSLITKYYIKREELEDVEKQVVSLKEQLKQSRIDYKNSLENVSQKENENHLLQDAYKKLEEDCFNFRNQYEAQKSHSNQLQVLLKEKETIIESLRVEKKLEKDGTKDVEKKLLSLSKENENISKDFALLADFVKKVVGKRKLKPNYSALLRKYITPSDGNNSDSGESSDVEDCVFEDALLSPPPSKNATMDKKCTIVANVTSPMELDTDCSNEFVSVDTGRGSSLASPDFFLNSPANTEMVESKPQVIFNDRVEITISPIMFVDKAEIATSPIIFKDTVEVSTSPITFNTTDNIAAGLIQFERDEISSTQCKDIQHNDSFDNTSSPIRFEEEYHISTIPIEARLEVVSCPTILEEIDHYRAIQLTERDEILNSPVLERIEIENSPITVPNENPDISVSENLFIVSDENNLDAVDSLDTPCAIKINSTCSPMNNITSDIVTCLDDDVHSDDINTNIQHTQNAQEKECLELNSSNNLRCNKESDYEIGLIFNEMQLNYKAVSPIPRTPNIARGTQIVSTPSSINVQTKNATNLQDYVEQLPKEFSTCEKSMRAFIKAYGNIISICGVQGIDYDNEAFLNEMMNTLESYKNKYSKINCGIEDILLDKSIENSDMSLETPQPNPVQSPIDSNLVLISNQSSNVSDTDSLQKNEGEIKKCQMSKYPTVQDQYLKQSGHQISHEVLEETFTDIDYDLCQKNNNVEANQTTTKDNNVKKAKRKKLTKLDKLKKNLKPKYKIKRETSPFVKVKKLKQVALTENKIEKNDTSASLNDQNVYAKAVKVMAEIKSKQTNRFLKSSCKPAKSSNGTTQLEEDADSDINTIKNQQTLPTSECKLKQACGVANSPTQLITKVLSPKVTTQQDEPYETDANIFNTKQSKSTSEFNLKPACNLLNPAPELISEKTTDVEDHVDNNANWKKTLLLKEITSNQITNPLNAPSKVFKEALSPKLTMSIDDHVDNNSICKQILSSSKSNVKQDCKSPNQSPNMMREGLSPNAQIDSKQKSLSKLNLIEGCKPLSSRLSRELTSSKDIIIFPMSDSDNCEQTSLLPQSNLQQGCKILTSPRRLSRELTALKVITEMERNINNSDNCEHTSPSSKLNLKHRCKTLTSPRRLSRESMALKVINQIEAPTDSTVNCEQTSTQLDFNAKKGCEPSSSPHKGTLTKLKIQLEENVDSGDSCNQTSPKIKRNPKQESGSLFPKLAAQSKEHINDNGSNHTSPNCLVATSKRKYDERLDQCKVILIKSPLIANELKKIATQKDKDENEALSDQSPRKRRRRSSNEPNIQCKRVLRSSIVNGRVSSEDIVNSNNMSDDSNMKTVEISNNKEIKMGLMEPSQTSKKREACDIFKGQQLDEHYSKVSYDDLDVFGEDMRPEKETSYPEIVSATNPRSCHPKESILCCMLEKYGVETVKPFAKKIPDTTVKAICEKFEQEIAKIIELPFNETRQAMDKFVTDLQKLNYKHFIAGMIKYLTKPERKIELFAKVVCPPAPAMTKSEQVLLYVISRLKAHWPAVDIVDAVLSNIEYTLFKLNRTPEFDVIDSASHFYAVLCRYFRAKSRLRLFILDAMYCIQYKSISLIKQCLEVWMHIIPLAHMGIAKTPLVTCLVYLLHFYKCEDKHNKVQEIRTILNRKYFYQITNWNEKKILDMFRHSIKELKDIPIEKKMLRLALIILAKRNGPRWCQNNIIKKLLQPIIEKENVPDTVKEFCVSMIGPLMKPYPVDMKVHCEIALNQFTDILNNQPSPRMEEAVITSMMFINRHDQYNINKTLLTRKMKAMSPELEGIMRDYVRTKPLKVWKKTLSKMARC